MDGSTEVTEASEEFWARDAWSFPDIDIGTDVFLLLAQVEKWVLRRIEKVRFVDDRSVRRQVTVDFELPLHPPLTRDQYLIPLALLTKQPLVGFDIWDESQTTLPILTRWENACVAWSMAASVAKFTLDSDIDPRVADDIFGIVNAEPEEAARLLYEFTQATDDVRRELSQDDVFRSLLQDLAANFVLIVPVKFERGRRRIIKFSYVETLELSDLTWRQRLGQEPAPFRFDLPAIDEGESFHFEIEAPEGLDVYEGEIVKASAEPGAPEEQIAYNGERSQRMHLYPRDAPKGGVAEARIWLIATAAGLVRASTIFAAGVFIMLLVLHFRLPQAAASAPQLLLAVPGLVALFLTRPAENRLATRMLFWFRAVVSFAGFLPFGGSLLLLLDLPSTPRIWAWGLLTGLSLFTLFVVAESYRASRKA